MACINVYTEGNISIPCNIFYRDPNEFCDPCMIQFQSTDKSRLHFQYISWHTCSGRLVFLHELETLYTHMDHYYDCSQYYDPVRDRTKERKHDMITELTRTYIERLKEKKKHIKYLTSISKSILGKRGKMYKRFERVPADLLKVILCYSY